MTETRKRRCKVVVYKRDTYRRTGRGRSGFEMHYDKCQCSRAAKDGMDCCAQHAAIEARNGNEMLRVDWHEYVEPRNG